MKKHLINLTLLALTFSQAIYSQNADPQWYVKDGKMIENGVMGSEVASKNILIENIRFPNINCNALARDYFFAIYADGTYYNTRNDESRLESQTSASEFEVGGLKYKNVGNNHTHLSLQGHTDFLYLYASNIYDEDPPEEEVRVSNQSSIELHNEILPNSIIPSISQRIQASHDVTPDTDITLILDLTDMPTNNYRISYNEVQIASRILNLNSSLQRNMQRDNLFVPSNIFDSANYYTNQPNNLEVLASDNGNFNFRLEKIADEPYYLYFNLRLNNIQELLQGDDATIGPDPNGLSLNKAVFKLYQGAKKQNQELLDTHTESIRYAHDPNKIVATSICKDKYKQRHLRYFCTFQNTGSDAAKELKVELSLPEILDKNKIKILSLKIEGEEIEIPSDKIKQSNEGEKTVFTFPDVAIGHCQVGDYEKGRVSFSFCAGLRQSEDNLSNRDLLESSYRISPARTIFNSKSGSQTFNLNFQDKTCTEKDKKNPTLECERIILGCDECTKNVQYWKVLGVMGSAGILGYAGYRFHRRRQKEAAILKKAEEARRALKPQHSIEKENNK